MTRRWLVDAMNVIGSRPDGWWNDPDGAMMSLAQLLDDYADATRDEVTAVFDRRADPPLAASRARLVYAHHRGRNAADREIEAIVRHEDHVEGLRVVTSDKDLRERVTATPSRASTNTF